MQDRTWEVSGGHKFSLWSWYGKKKAFRGWSKCKSGGWQALANSSDPWRTAHFCEEPMGYLMVLHLKICRINFSPIDYSFYWRLLFPLLPLKNFPNHNTEMESLFICFNSRKAGRIGFNYLPSFCKWATVSEKANF